MTKCKLALNDMNRVLIRTHKSSIHRAFHPKLLLQGFRIAFNQGVVSTSFVDVNLFTLQRCVRTELICTQLLWFCVRVGRKSYLD